MAIKHMEELLEEELDLSDGEALNPDEAQAMLAFNTNVMEGMIPQEEGSVDEEMALEQEEMEEPEDVLTPRIEGLESKFTELEQNVQQTIKDEVSGIKTMIEQLLTEDDGEEKQA